MKLEEITRNPKDVKISQEVLAEAEDKEPGSITTAQKLCDWIKEYTDNTRRSLDIKNVRLARLHLKEIQSAAKQLEQHISAIAKKMGLPDLD